FATSNLSLRKIISLNDAVGRFFRAAPSDINPNAKRIFIYFFMGNVVDLCVDLVAALKILKPKENTDGNDGDKYGGYRFGGEVSGSDACVIWTVGISCATVVL